MSVKWLVLALFSCALAPNVLSTCTPCNADDSHPNRISTELSRVLHNYCVDCHGAETQEAEIRLDVNPDADWRESSVETWLKVRSVIDTRQMPPKDSVQLTDDDQRMLQEQVKSWLLSEALHNAGDPGPVVLRRLSNAEYNYAVQDLTGVKSLDPTREFPIDGAAGEGFTNTGASQGMSPALTTKYLDAAKEIAEHLVLLPKGIRFTQARTQRDETDNLMAQIQAFYARYTRDGGGQAVDLQGIKFDTNQGGVLPIERYLAATKRNADALSNGSLTLEQVAAQEKLSPKYLETIWQILSADRSTVEYSWHADLQQSWRNTNAQDMQAIADRLQAVQQQLWRFNPVGQIGRDGAPTRWLEEIAPADPAFKLRLIETASTEDSITPNAEEIAKFRSVFPPALCYARIVPVDEVVTLTLFYREDEILQRLMLSDAEIAELNSLWEEFEFVSQEPLKYVVALEQLTEFATQDRQDLVGPFTAMKEPTEKRAAAFRDKQIAAEPSHVAALLAWTDKAWRRPLDSKQRASLDSFYKQLRAQEVPHEAAVKLLLTRILTSPAFLFKLERQPIGVPQQAVDNWELASRLSFFLTSSLPDEQLITAVRSSGDSPLNDEQIIAQTNRLLTGEQVERLAIHFACQWLHVRDFDQNNDKNEAMFPEFADMRSDMYRETVLYFEDFFRNDRSVLSLIDSDSTFLNEKLAQAYGISGVSEGWKRIEGVRSQGRGGVLTMATVLASQSGASRTSPILRGNWISETLLGERLPRPPANVPQLPDSVPVGLNERQLIEMHSSDPACAKCHQRIDPYGFALEQFDALGRQRSESMDVQVTLPDGTSVNGASELKKYLLTVQREAIVRNFSRKLLGYALGREVQLSDEPLLEAVFNELAANDYRIHVAINVIVTSRQFREIRGDLFESSHSH